MAKIRPFKAWRYNHTLTENIGDLLSPPFDVVSARQRAALYRNPFNSIHLSVPSREQPSVQAAQTLAGWKQKGILVQDRSPAIYVYYQYFQLPCDTKKYCRKGFICMIEASFWEKKIVLRHEDTIPHSVNDRLQLLENTLLNASPTHGLYTDTAHQLEALMDKSMETPLYQAEDFQGVRDQLSMIQDAAAIQQFVSLMADKQIILADGHHRYESSLAYRRKMMESSAAHQGDEAYNFHLMYLSNTESDDLKVLPTHRLVKNPPTFDSKQLLEKCSRYFNVQALDSAEDIPEIIAGKPWTFSLITKDECYKIQLKQTVFDQLQLEISDTVKKLDVVILHYFFLEKVLGIPYAAQPASAYITYERNFANCLYQLRDKQDVQIALITNGVDIQQIKEVCYGGHLLPQKSTYFYPKVICGFLFGSIHEKEF